MMSVAQGGAQGTRDGHKLVKSGVRVLEIFEYFERVKRPARSIEVGLALGMPKSSANELLKTLVETGYVTFNFDDKTYFPSFRLIKFGFWLSSAYFGTDHIKNLMDELSRMTGESVAVSVQNGNFLQYVAILRGPGYLPEFYREGTKASIVGSAAGGALLTTKTDDEVARMVRLAVASCSGNVPGRVDAFVERIRDFRRKGYAVTYGGIDPEIASMAMVLPRTASNVPMMIGVGGESLFRYRDREAELADMMSAAIRKYTTP